MSNKLQKKFLRGEIKSGKISSADEASEIINRIKSLNKSADLPPPLPAEAIAVDFDLLRSEISRTMQVSFNVVKFVDTQSMFAESALTVDLMLSLTKIIALHNTADIFEGFENVLYCDCASKDIFVYLSLSINPSVNYQAIEDYISAVLDKLNARLRPYGSTCKIQLSQNLFMDITSLNFIFFVNRLENFANAEFVEKVETKVSVAGVVRV